MSSYTVHTCSKAHQSTSTAKVRTLLNVVHLFLSTFVLCLLQGGLELSFQDLQVLGHGRTAACVCVWCIGLGTGVCVCVCGAYV